jgi:uncharacterized repeat protein (TIGR03806 family)
MNMGRWLAAAFIIVTIVSFRQTDPVGRKDKLSAYGFFTGKLSDLKPAEHVIPYSLNMPLFSNYAEKLRFVVVPENKMAAYNDSVVFDFPVGTILIKNFYYPSDFRKPEALRKILETRLLVHQPSGWEAWPYIWNDEQTDAVYDPAGETKQIAYIDNKGKKIVTNYVIPNKNQCKGCHAKGTTMVPIGPSARQLNMSFNYSSGIDNQLAFWKKKGLIDNVPDSSIPRMAVWNDPSSGTINERARAYLDANCAHCHSRRGPASTSGLYLDVLEKDLTHLGINKPPVAAGRGAGDMQFDIVPGQPDKSIMVFRMKTNDPAIAMPEIGREQVHREGVALIEEWIRQKSFQQ